VTAGDHHLRLALAEFLEAKRALRQAYRRVSAANVPDDWMALFEWEDTDQGMDESVMRDELQELKDDNERLRRALAVLHIHSLRLRDQRDILLEQRDELVNACAAIVRCMRDEQRVETSSDFSPGQFDDAALDRANGEHSTPSFR